MKPRNLVIPAQARIQRRRMHCGRTDAKSLRRGASVERFSGVDFRLSCFRRRIFRRAGDARSGHCRACRARSLPWLKGVGPFIAGFAVGDLAVGRGDGTCGRRARVRDAVRRAEIRWRCVSRLCRLGPRPDPGRRRPRRRFRTRGGGLARVSRGAHARQSEGHHILSCVPLPARNRHHRPVADVSFGANVGAARSLIALWEIWDAAVERISQPNLPSIRRDHQSMPLRGAQVDGAGQSKAVNDEGLAPLGTGS